MKAGTWWCPRWARRSRIRHSAGRDQRAPLASRSLRECPIPASRPTTSPRPAAPRAHRRGRRRRRPRASRFVLWAYTATTFLSALLLFSVQPMFAKMVLPVLGGSPSVWAVAIFFFQAALLAGYCYAHLLIAQAPAPHDGLHPSRRLPAGVPGAADRAAGGLERAAAGRALPVAARALHGGDRPAVPGGLGQRAAAAGVVRPHRPSARARSLLPVRGEQPRQPDRAAGLSVRAGAGVRAEGAEPAVDRAVPAADRRLGAGLLADAPGAGRAGGDRRRRAGRGRERSRRTPRRPGPIGWAGSAWRWCRRRC